MQLKEIGEFGFIENFAKNFNSLLGKNMLGIGDDCAIFSAGEKEDYTVSTDLLVEDTHFILPKIGYYQLGQKSLAVNLSDLAAMGATPFASFLSLGVPAQVPAEKLSEFMQGYYDLSAQHNIPLLGGDTTSSSDKLIINICVIGKVQKGKAKLRSTAQAGDIVCVTGNLGDSAGGLQLLLQGISTSSKAEQTLVDAHHKVSPKVAEGQFLGKEAEVTAMIDISDGIASDLQHILKSSKLGAQIELSKLPLSAELQKVCSQQGWSAPTLAVSGGEDYQLLFALHPLALERLQKKYQQIFGQKFFPIGTLTKTPPTIVWTKEKKPYNWQPKGFDHFD